MWRIPPGPALSRSMGRGMRVATGTPNKVSNGDAGGSAPSGAEEVGGKIRLVLGLSAPVIAGRNRAGTHPPKGSAQGWPAF